VSPPSPGSPPLLACRPRQQARPGPAGLASRARDRHHHPPAQWPRGSPGHLRGCEPQAAANAPGAVAATPPTPRATRGRRQPARLRRCPNSPGLGAQPGTPTENRRGIFCPRQARKAVVCLKQMRFFATTRGQKRPAEATEGGSGWVPRPIRPSSSPVSTPGFPGPLTSCPKDPLQGPRSLPAARKVPAPFSPASRSTSKSPCRLARFEPRTARILIRVLPGRIREARGRRPAVPPGARPGGCARSSDGRRRRAAVRRASAGVGPPPGRRPNRYRRRPGGSGGQTCRSHGPQRIQPLSSRSSTDRATSYLAGCSQTARAWKWALPHLILALSFWRRSSSKRPLLVSTTK